MERVSGNFEQPSHIQTLAPAKDKNGKKKTFNMFGFGMFMYGDKVETEI